jgi:hypothetical protein
MLPGMGAFWFGVITAIFREKEPEGGEHKYPEAGNNGINSLFSRAEIFLPAALVLLMSVIGIRDYYAFRGNELYRRVNMVKTSELFDELKNHDNLVIVSNFDQVDALLAFYLNEDALNGTDDDEGHDTSILLYGYEPEKLIAEMVKGVGSIEDGDAVEKLLKEGKEVYFLGSFNSREDILRDWNSEQGIENENHGSYLMERYWFDVFELSLME